MVIPKAEKANSEGIRYHSNNLPIPDGVRWVFEKATTSFKPQNLLLVRIIIGKVIDKDRLDAVFDRVPVRGDVDGWNCIARIKEALGLLEEDGEAIGASITD